MITVDRIEGKWAVLCLADETTRTVSLCALPPNLRAGDVLTETPQGLEIDTAATAARRERAKQLRRRL